MSGVSNLAMWPWRNGEKKLPYTIDTSKQTYDHWRYESLPVLTVRAVTLKTGFAAAIRNMRPHAITEAASVTVGGKVFYAVTWLCNPQQGSIDAVLLPAGIPSGLCQMCAAKLDGEGPGMYRIFDGDGLLIYIGSSVRVQERVMHHRLRAKWNSRIAEVTITRFPTLAQARAAEYHAIRAEKPQLNVTHLRGEVA